MESPQKEIELTIIKKKAVSGVLALTSRTFLLQLIAFAATFLLTIFLSPAIFGVFYVVSAIIAFLGYFSDVGLAAALIQKKEDLTREDLVTTFTIQQLLVGAIVAIAMLFSGWISSFYRLDDAGVWLLRSLIVAFFLSSLKTIPSIILERQLEFKKLVIPQIVETLGFYVTAVALAWRGFGITSFTYAVLVRAILGVVSLYILSPWRMGIGITHSSAKRLLTFGLPFQVNSFLALLKDDLLTVYLGKILPFAEVGYIGWAKKWAEVPLRLIMDSVIRVTFPAFARLQHDKKILGTAIEKTLFGLALTIFPITIGLLFFIRPIVAIVPRYSKWEPALFSFALFAVASAVAALSTPLTNALNAVGKVKTTLKLMMLWTATTWILTTLLVGAIGFNGVALSLLLITSTVALVVRWAKQISQFSFVGSVRGPLVAALIQGGLYALLRVSAMTNPLWLAATGWVGVILYVGTVWVFERQKLIVFIGYIYTKKIHE
ncbi:oligosaccharide flippase family protein [Candidatus Gottesmanbacteria bacterium]|nr:oligosaccharide flippase family protein [Candidatus Gottesmanbacteria bacterium]